VLEEVGDVHAGRQLDQPLPEPQQEVIDLGGFRLGLLPGDFPQREGLLLAPEPEENAITAATFLKFGHCCGSNATAMLLPICYQRHSRRREKGFRRIDVTPFPAKCRREDLNLHGHG
jgi:hypothetical protein